MIVMGLIFPRPDDGQWALSGMGWGLGMALGLFDSVSSLCLKKACRVLGFQGCCILGINIGFGVASTLELLDGLSVLIDSLYH